MKKRAIFYGAGENAKKNIERWENEGWKPICFVDKNEKLWHKKLLVPNDIEGKYAYPILPLSEAKKLYSNVPFFVATLNDKWKEIWEYLTNNGIREEFIYMEGQNLEWRLGCSVIGQQMVFADSLQICCLEPWCHKSNMALASSPEENIEQWIDMQKTVMAELRGVAPYKCSGCPNLEYGFWNREPELSVVNISSKRNEDFCNARCIYCCKYPMPANEIFNKRGKDVVKLLEKVHEVFPTKRIHVVASGGDIAVAPFRNGLFEILRKYNWTAEMYSNSIVYCEEIAEQLKDGVSIYYTTLDSTDPEIFKKIKGVDAVSKAMTTIRRYAMVAPNRAQIRIKLIVLDGIYTSVEEILGVVDFAREIGADLVLSYNAQTKFKCMSKKMFQITCEWIKYARDQKVPVRIMYDHFYNDDAEKLRKGGI